MGILKKLQGNEELDPKERTEKANFEIEGILRKYNCGIDTTHRIVIVALEEQKKTEKEKEQENYNKA